MIYAFTVLAEQSKGGEGTGNMFFLLMLFIPMLYLLIVVLPGRRRQEKERLEMLNRMEKGTKVLTIAGIYGEVISVSPDKDEVVVKVDDGTRLRMTKSSIARNLTAEDDAKKAKEAKQAPAVQETK